MIRRFASDPIVRNPHRCRSIAISNLSATPAYDRPSNDTFSFCLYILTLFPSFGGSPMLICDLRQYGVPRTSTPIQLHPTLPDGITNRTVTMSHNKYGQGMRR